MAASLRIPLNSIHENFGDKVSALNGLCDGLPHTRVIGDSTSTDMIVIIEASDEPNFKNIVERFYEESSFLVTGP